MQSVTRTWTYGLGVRIFIGCVVAIMFAFAAFLISIPLLVPGNLTGVAWLLDVCGLDVAGFGCLMLFGLIAFSLVRWRRRPGDALGQDPRPLVHHRRVHP